MAFSDHGQPVRLPSSLVFLITYMVSSCVVFHDDDDPVGPFWLHKIGGVGEDSESRMTEIISD